MRRPFPIGQLSAVTTALGMLLASACSGTAGEPVASSDPEALTSTCSSKATTNTYDGPSYWGTITMENTGTSAWSGYAVTFTVPSGAHCTNDAVPSGAKLSPLSGSGSSATTKSNVCTFTWASAKLAAGASATFNYSTDSTSFSAASKVTASSASCGGSGSSSGGSGSSSGGSGSSSGGSGSSSGGSGSSSGGTTFGCESASGCAVWTHVYQTWYGFNDNSCTTESQHSCNDIAYPGYGPKKHQVATEGAGTADDPVTAASSDQGWETSGGATLQPGTLIYNPQVHKYFVMEDSCLECGDEYKCHLSSDDTDDPKPPSGCKPGANLHIDFWMGPNDSAQNATQLNDCEDNLTLGNPYAGVGDVIVNPPTNLPVDTTPIFTGGKCTSHTYADPP